MASEQKRRRSKSVGPTRVPTTPNDVILKFLESQKAAGKSEPSISQLREKFGGGFTRLVRLRRLSRQVAGESTEPTWLKQLSETVLQLETKVADLSQREVIFTPTPRVADAMGKALGETWRSSLQTVVSNLKDSVDNLANKLNGPDAATIAQAVVDLLAARAKPKRRRKSKKKVAKTIKSRRGSAKLKRRGGERGTRSTSKRLKRKSPVRAGAAARSKRRRASKSTAKRTPTKKPARARTSGRRSR